MDITVYEGEVEWVGFRDGTPSFSGYLRDTETGVLGGSPMIIPFAEIEEGDRHLIRIGARFYYMLQNCEPYESVRQVTIVRRRP